MAEVVKGKWYPAPVPSLPEESDVDYTNRMLGLAGKESPYDHIRYRECSLGYHRSCTQRAVLGLRNAFTDNKLSYTGKCQCPCHFDDYSLVAEESLREAVQILSECYDLPNRTGWHIMHTVDLMTGTTTPAGPVRVYSVAARLREEYGSEITHFFAVDVVQILANKGPAGPARAFWRKVYRHRDEPSPTLSDVVRMAMEKAMAAPLRLPEPPRKPNPLSEILPQVTLFGTSRLRNPEMPVSILGFPVEVDDTLPPGTWGMRSGDGSLFVQDFPRVRVSSETLDEAIKRVTTNPFAPPPGSVASPSFAHWLFRQSWFTRGVARIDASHVYGVDRAKLAWYIPATLAESFRIQPGQPHDTELYGVKVRVHDKLRGDAAPILAFDLEEI